jgi:hypothetical protein
MRLSSALPLSVSHERVQRGHQAQHPAKLGHRLVPAVARHGDTSSATQGSLPDRDTEASRANSVTASPARSSIWSVASASRDGLAVVGAALEQAVQADQGVLASPVRAVAQDLDQRQDSGRPP